MIFRHDFSIENHEFPIQSNHECTYLATQNRSARLWNNNQKAAISQNTIQSHYTGPIHWPQCGVYMSMFPFPSWSTAPESVILMQNPSFVMQNTSFITNNSSFLIQNSSFLIQNSSFLMQNSSFLMQNSHLL